MAPSYAGFFAALIIILTPGVSAGTREDPEMRDPKGDVNTSPLPSGTDPRQDAADILAVWFHNETNETLNLSVQTLNLSKALDGPPAGYPLYVYVHFHIRYSPGNQTTNFTVYFDYRDNPAGAKGWRFLFRTPLEKTLNGSVDLAASTATLELPRSFLGSPTAGSSIWNLFVGGYTGYYFPNVLSVDFAPNGRNAEYGCQCGYNFTLGPSAFVNRTVDEGGSSGEEAPAFSLPLVLLGLLAAVYVVRVGGQRSA